MKITKIYCVRLPSNIQRVGEAVNEIIDHIDCNHGPLNEGSLFELKVVLSEIVLNAVKHGNKENENKIVKIAVYIVDDSFISFVVEDEGTGYDLNCLPDPQNIIEGEEDLYDIMESGRGILLVNSLCDKVKVNAR
ncbi:MAG: ATP-binding protein, partial [Clostridiales bacterium]|nr:ATP-binding protein [Clostridiales bacterium]